MSHAINYVRLGLCLLVIFFGATLASQQAQEPIDVSLIQIISNPDKNDGKLVRMIGFLRLEFEGDALYLHREDYENALTKNAIWIDATSEMKKKNLDHKYVLVEGTFDSKRLGHMGLFSGELHEVRRAEAWGAWLAPKKSAEHLGERRSR